MNRTGIVFCLTMALFCASTACADVPWFRTETGATNPATDPYWDVIDGDPTLVTAALSGSTLTGDSVYLNIDDDVDDDKIKIRREVALNGSGSTTRAILRVNSGGGTNNYGFEYRDSFGQLTLTLRKNQGDDNGVVRFDDSGAEMPVLGIASWHVYWFVHAPNNMTYLWVDPDGSESALASADLSAPGGSGTGTRITWGTESSGQLMDYDVDDVRWALGIHLPADDPTLPRADTPTPTFTATNSCTPTATPTGPTPTATNTVPGPPRIELSMLRQIGYYENQQQYGGIRALYVHFAGADGNPIDGGQVLMNGVQIGTTFTDFPVSGWLQYPLDGPNVPGSFRIGIRYNGVTSEETPTLHFDVPPFSRLYSWEMHFRYRPDSGAPLLFKPTDRTYDHAHVRLNTADGAVNPDTDYKSDQFQIIGSAGNSYAQTFVANANRIVSAKCFITTEFMALVQYEATIHAGGPDGPQIGGAVRSPSYLSVEYPKISVFWPLEGPNAVVVQPGQTYAVKFTKVAAGTPGTFSVHHNVTNSYAGGTMYRDGAALPNNVDILGIVVSAQFGADPYADDIDRDGLCDCAERPNLNTEPDHSNMLLEDTDGDGLLDGEEDANRNGLPDTGETLVRNRDTDGDQYIDGIEVLLGLDPLMPNAGYTDADGDGLPDSHDPNSAAADTDADGYKDGYEAAYLADPGAAGDSGLFPPLGDANGDATISNLDALVTQSLFIGVMDHRAQVFNQAAPGHYGFRYLDPNRDGYITSLDALVLQSYFLGVLAALPL